MPSPERSDPATVLRLYVRDGCHLCEEAEQMIAGLRGRVPPFELELVDIEADWRLHGSYLERIPVAEVAGDEIFELVPDEDALLEALSTSGTL